MLPGRVRVSRGIELPNRRKEWGTPPLLFDDQTAIVNGDGEPTAVLFGGQGQTVSGRLTGRDSWERVTFKYLPEVPHLGGLERRRAFTGRLNWEDWQKYDMWERSSVGPLYFRSGLKPNADGSFEISHVLPGRYYLFISAPDATHYVGRADFSVEHEQPGEAPPPVDLGEIKINPAAKPVIQLKEGELFLGDVGDMPR